MCKDSCYEGDMCFICLQRTELGMIMMAVENLAEKCRRRLDPEIDEMDLDQKLHVVQVFNHTYRASSRTCTCNYKVLVQCTYGYRGITYLCARTCRTSCCDRLHNSCT